MMRTSFALSFLIALVVLSTCVASPAQIGIGISVNFGPPALPVYVQPPCPAPGYMWTPGYWAWNPAIGEYYWVPGTWVPAPQPGFFWTPPWWGWNGVAFIFHEGWWGPHIGFYGGINYGFGYPGTGFWGGRWQGNQFYYNRSVTNVNVTNITNVYNTTVVNNNSHVSYNGGQGGTTAQPTPEEKAPENEKHIGPVAAQTEHAEAARNDPQLRANNNQGKPPIAATARPGEFRGNGVEAAQEAGAPYKPQAARSSGETSEHPENYVPRPPGASGSSEHTENNVPRPPTHASEVQPHEFTRPNTGDANLDQKYQQQQDKLNAKMNREHQKLQQKQEQEHQKAQQRNYNDAQRQQMEQRHEQQTQKMEQRHTQQMQKLQQHQQPHPSGGAPRR